MRAQPGSVPCWRLFPGCAGRNLNVNDAAAAEALIGDIVKDIMAQQGQHIQYLETYIKGHAVEY